MSSRKFNQLYHETHNWKKKTVIPNVSISPDLAEELLKLNGKNRPVSDSVVKRYIKDMKDDKWLFNGDSIRLSNEGLIVDGQKRLLAILESGITQVFNLQTGLDPKSFEVVDIGQPRSASDTLAVAGFKNYGVLSGAVKLIMAHDKGSLSKQVLGGKSSLRPSNQDILNYAEKKLDIDLLQECGAMGNRCVYRFKAFSGATYSAFLYLFSLKDKEQAFYFFDLLSSGENIGKGNHSMIFLLRNKLISLQQSSIRLQTLDKYAILIKAWNYFRRGREIAQLSWQPKENFPNIQ